jgi:hypothetical protein
MSLNESMFEDAALTWFGELGYAVGHGPHLAPTSQRQSGMSFVMWCWWGNFELSDG